MKIEIESKEIVSIAWTIGIVSILFLLMVIAREVISSDNVITMHKLSLEQSYNMQSKGKK